jgi:S1-C subfamily serine protease
MENTAEVRRYPKGFVVIIVLLITFMISSSVFTYMVLMRQSTNDYALQKQIDSLQQDTQSKLNQITDSVVKTQNELSTVGAQIGSINQTISTIKASTSSDFSGIIGNVIKSVVTVRTDVSQGSGFVIADGGYIVTNAHVMQGAQAASVITYDGQTHKVTLIGQDANMDIALLKISDAGYSPLTLEDSSNVQVGEKVIAIGNPLGLQFSVSEGIVSAKDRQGTNGLFDYIQTDASLNPGNSGGPLIDVNGKVIGINNFKLSGSENIGFALESNYIKDTVNNIYNQTYGTNLI